MKQVDARTTRVRLLGGFMFLVKATAGLFGIFLIGVSLFGWYELVWFRYFSSWWLFLSLMALAFVGLAAVQYFILTPVEFSFVARQSYMHDNPYTADVKAIRAILEKEFGP